MKLSLIITADPTEGDCECQANLNDQDLWFAASMLILYLVSLIIEPALIARKLLHLHACNAVQATIGLLLLLGWFTWPVNQRKRRSAQKHCWRNYRWLANQKLQAYAAQVEELAAAAERNRLATERQSADGLVVDLCLTGSRRLPAKMEEELYHIAQEALNNIVKHAQTSQAKLTLTLEETDRVLILTSFGESSKVVPAIRARAQGYLLKDIRPDDLIQAVREAYQGKTQLHPDIAQKLMEIVAGNDPLA